MAVGKHFGRPGVCRRVCRRYSVIDAQTTGYKLQDRGPKATGEKVGLKMNVPKTKLMKVMTKQDGTVNIGQESIEEVEEFQYLGSIISKTGCTCEDIKARIDQ